MLPKPYMEIESAHITPVGGNVFLDLGFEPDEAVILMAESQRIIQKKLTRKNPCMRNNVKRVSASL